MRRSPAITYTDFELIFSNYTQVPDAAVLKQAFVGVQEVVVDATAKTARVRFQQKGQAQAAYEATFNSETSTGVYDRVIAQYMPNASFDSMEEFSKALGEAMSQPPSPPQRQRQRRAPRR